MRYKIEHGGLDARAGSKVTALFLLGQDIADFAKEGDLIWDVKITRGADRISDELWISSTTGQVKSILLQPKAILPNTKDDGKETR
jgi:hypothetical protein